MGSTKIEGRQEKSRLVLVERTSESFCRVEVDVWLLGMLNAFRIPNQSPSQRQSHSQSQNQIQNWEFFNWKLVVCGCESVSVSVMCSLLLFVGSLVRSFVHR